MTQVIVLNGGSSSGKSTIARARQEVLPGQWLTYDVEVDRTGQSAAACARRIAGHVRVNSGG